MARLVRATLTRQVLVWVAHGCLARFLIMMQHHIVSYQEALSRHRFGSFRWLVQLCEAAQMHKIGPNQAGEHQRAAHRGLGLLRQPQEQEGDQRDGDLDATAFSEKPRNFLILRVCLTHRKNSSIANGIL